MTDHTTGGDGEQWPSRAYMFDLLFEHEPDFDVATMVAALRRRFDVAQPRHSDDGHFVGFRLGGTNERPGPFLGVFPPAPFQATRADEALQQTWGWESARNVVGRCTHSVLVSDLLGHLTVNDGALEQAPHIDRVERMCRALDGLVEVLRPAAVLCPAIQCVREPAVFAMNDRDAATVIDPFLNVRLFRVENSTDDEVVMDTLGLAALGLPDIQCRVSGLDLGAVAALLRDTGAYVLQHGDVIEHGNTIGGLNGQPWACRRGPALVGPAREVIGIAPPTAG